MPASSWLCYAGKSSGRGLSRSQFWSDAVHIAQRIAGALATFDEKVAANARILDMPLVAL